MTNIEHGYTSVYADLDLLDTTEIQAKHKRPQLDDLQPLAGC